MMRYISFFLCVFLSTGSVQSVSADSSQKPISKQISSAISDPNSVLISGFSAEKSVSAPSFVSEPSVYTFAPITRKRHIWWWAVLGTVVAVAATSDPDDVAFRPTIGTAPVDDPTIIDSIADGQSANTASADTNSETIDSGRQDRGVFFTLTRSTNETRLPIQTPDGSVSGNIEGNNYKASLGYDEWAGDNIILGAALSLQNSETVDDRYDTKSSSSGGSLVTFFNVIANKHIDFSGFLGHSRDNKEREVGLGIIRRENQLLTVVDVDQTSNGKFTQYENFVGIQSSFSKMVRETIAITSALELEFSDIQTDGFYAVAAGSGRRGTVLPSTQSSKTSLRFSINTTKNINTRIGVAVLHGGIQYTKNSYGGDSAETIDGTQVSEGTDGSLTAITNDSYLTDRITPIDDSQTVLAQLGLSFIFKRGIQGFTRYEQEIGGSDSNITRFSLGFRAEF